ncbi:MAG: hypothetical protein CMP21_08880 [Rickettsiales bacterium]|nr:hypothetical protein [Rickettsiales bacterium]|tara:strand:+ start:169 stop:360 length:192 start_codon:yes stop_codon:yes gene_type:complete
MQIKKINKDTGVCLCCGDVSIRVVQWYEWYSIFDGRLLLEKICKKCAKRELGSKNKKAWEKYL